MNPSAPEGGEGGHEPPTIFETTSRRGKPAGFLLPDWQGGQIMQQRKREVTLSDEDSKICGTQCSDCCPGPGRQSENSAVVKAYDPAPVSTDSCILVGCLIDADGVTEFAMGKMHEVDPGRLPAFEGNLKTPTRRISLESVDGRTVLEAPVLHLETKVRIWTNHESEPDKVIVGFE